MSEAEVQSLPDPDLLRDAMFLAPRWQGSGRDLDETDALLLALIKLIHNSRRD